MEITKGVNDEKAGIYSGKPLPAYPNGFPQELYRYCEIARQMLQGEHGAGRVIARPFSGKVKDIFAGKGITEAVYTIYTKGNEEGIKPAFAGTSML